MAVELEYSRGATPEEVRRREGRRVFLCGGVAAILAVAGGNPENMLLPVGCVGWILGLWVVMKGLVAVVRRRGPSGLAIMGYVLGLLAVVAPVVGMVMYMTVGGGHSRVEMARRNGTATCIAELSTAVEAFKADNGRYPTTAEGLEALLRAPAGLAGRWKGPYIKGGRLPLDAWGRNFDYWFPGKKDPSTFDVISPGSDGTPGTDDDIDRDS